MTGARMYRVRTRLSKTVNDPNGMAVSRAIAAGEAVLPKWRERTLKLTDEVLADIEARFGPQAEGREQRDLMDLYRNCLKIIDYSVPAPEFRLQDAAHALCDLIDLGLERNVIDWEAIDVHQKVLRLLRFGAEQSPLQRELLLTGLKKVTEKRVGA